MKKLLHGTLIRTDPHETGKGDTYQAKVYGGFFCTCALHHRRQKINGNFYLEVMVFSRHSTSSFRIFSISSKSVFVSGNTDFKR